MVKTYHVFRIVQLLDDFAKIPASVASEQWDSAWVVVRNVPESIDALFRWELFLDQKDERQRYNSRTLEVVRAFRQDTPPQPNHEIVAHGFFAPEALPAETTRATRERLAEVLSGRTPAELW